MNPSTDHITKPKYSSKLSEETESFWLTFCTPAWQRESTMERLYCSLLAQQMPEGLKGKVLFEWLIVNDGSTDGTEELVKGWCEENKLPIRYYYQENQGKHIAVNLAIRNCRSEMILVIDSDDTLLPVALKTFYEEWQKIEDKEHFKGVTGRCIDPETGKLIGTKLPRSPFDVHTTDMRLKYRVKGEMCGFNRVDIMKKYILPSYDKRIRFYPEGIRWYEIAKMYKERVVDIPVREYYKDTGNALTHRSTNRAYANFYLWQYIVNNLMRYSFYSPGFVLKGIVGVSMDGFKTGRSIGEMLSGVNGVMRKCLVSMFLPCGYLLSKL